MDKVLIAYNNDSTTILHDFLESCADEAKQICADNGIEYSSVYDIKMNKEEFQTKKNDIDSKIRELKNQKIQLEKEYIESNQGFPVGSKVCITVLAHERYIFGNNERILVPEAKKLAYIADYEIDDNGEVVPSLRQLDYNGGMSAIPLFVNLKKDIIELV